MFRFYGSLCLIYLLFVGSMAAQSASWSLERCIDHAHENNLSVQQAKLSREVADNMLLQSQLSFLPTLNASANFNINFGNSVDPTTYAFTKETTQSSTYSFNANLPLFMGLQRWQGVKKGKLDALAAHYDLLELREQISLSLTTIYLQILLNKEVVKGAALRLEQTKEQLKNSEQLVDAGLIPAGDLLSIEAQLAADETSLLQAETAEQLSLTQLRMLLDLPSTADFDIEQPEFGTEVPELDAYDANSLITSALADKPAIKSAELRQQSSEKNVLIARGSQYPTLSMYSSVRTTWFSESRTFLGFDGQGNPIFDEPGFGNQLNENLSQSVGLSLGIPLFSGWQKRISIENAQLDVERASYSLQESKNTLSEAVERAYAEALGAEAAYRSKLKSAAASDKSFEHISEKNKLGAATSLEYLTAKNAKTLADTDLLQSKFEYLFKLKVLDFYKGEKLSFD